jgi:hypothetical protein
MLGVGSAIIQNGRPVAFASITLIENESSHLVVSSVSDDGDHVCQNN